MSQTDQRGIASELKEARRRVAKLEKDIKDEQRRLSEADGGKNAERRLDLENRQTRADIAKQDHEMYGNELPGLQITLRAAQKTVLEAQELLSKQKEDVKSAEDKLNALRHDRGQQMTAYPNSMPRLLASIQRDGDFREKPVGPIGSHVRLLQPSWSSVLEKQFGGALDSFIVTCKEDQSRLASLMHSCGWYFMNPFFRNLTNAISICPILISNKTRLDTSDHEPDPMFDTWLRVLEVRF